LVLLAVLLHLLMNANPAHPLQVRVFDNDSSNNQWTTAINWDPDGVPGPGDDAVLNSTTSGTIVTLQSAASIASLSLSDNELRVSSPGSLSLGGTSTELADGTLTLLSAPLTAGGWCVSYFFAGARRDSA
jgi:hypothetical protein